MKIRFVVPLLALALAFCARAEDGGSLKGTIKLDGDVPELPKKVIAEEKKAGCTCNDVPDESLVVDKATKGIKWTIIRILDVPGDPAPAPKEPYKLDQKGCMFTPHIVVVAPKTDLLVANPDKIMHNIHTLAFDSNDPQQNTAATADLTYKAKWLADPDIIQITCDVHNWMKGYILCHDPRYCAVTGADGTFEIKNVPPGKYKLNIWQETLGNFDGKETIDIEIKAGAVKDLGDLKFKPKAKK